MGYAAVDAKARPSLDDIEGHELLESSERKALEKTLTTGGSAAVEKATDDATKVSATPSTAKALGVAEGDQKQPAKGKVTKAKGKVCWRFGGALCFGTLLPAQESATTCYAR